MPLPPREVRGARTPRSANLTMEHFINYNTIVLKKCVASTAGFSPDDKNRVSDIRVFRSMSGQAIRSPLRGKVLIDPKQKCAVALKMSTPVETLPTGALIEERAGVWRTRYTPGTGPLGPYDNNGVQ